MAENDNTPRRIRVSAAAPRVVELMKVGAGTSIGYMEDGRILVCDPNEPPKIITLAPHQVTVDSISPHCVTTLKVVPKSR